MVIILDLDGTILSVNSFALWADFLAKGRFAHLSPLRRLKIGLTAAWAIASCKLHMTDQCQLKWRLQKLWQDSIVGDNGASEQCLVRELMSFIRPELRDVLSTIGEGQVDAILATEAAGDYAQALGRTLGFQNILATSPNRNPKDPDNQGGEKFFAVLRLITDRGWQDRPRILFTDHRDDLPLIRISKSVKWFGSEAERAEIQASVPYVKIYSGFSKETFASHIAPSTRLRQVPVTAMFAA